MSVSIIGLKFVVSIQICTNISQERWAKCPIESGGDLKQVRLLAGFFNNLVCFDGIASVIMSICGASLYR